MTQRRNIRVERPLRGHKQSYFRSIAYKHPLSKAKYCGLLQLKPVRETGKNTLMPEKRTLIISKVLNCTSSWKWCVGHCQQNWCLKFPTLSFASWLTASVFDYLSTKLQLGVYEFKNTFPFYKCERTRFTRQEMSDWLRKKCAIYML